MATPRNGRVAIAVAALLLQFAAQAAVADDDLATQLQRMSRAMRDGNYQGSLVYQHDGRTDSLKLFHAAGKPERERLVSLSGDAREVARRGGDLVCRQGEAPAFLVSNSADRSLIPLVPVLRAADLGRVYRLVAVGEERVAGYSAKVIDLRPADEFRYGYRLWLEKDSNLLLRAALMGSNGAPLEQMMFVTLEIGAAPNDQDVTMPNVPAPQMPSTGDAESPMPGAATWEFAELPPGFRVQSRLSATGAAAAQHLLLTDGVANVSVYVEQRGASPMSAVSMTTRGALSIYGLDVDGQHVVVLGNVPAATAQRIGQSLRPVAAPPAGK